MFCSLSIQNQQAMSYAKWWKSNIVWQGNATSWMKSFGKLNCSLCMQESIEILRTIRQEEWKIINHCNEIYGACQHKTRFHRFLKEHTNAKNTSTDDGNKPEKVYKYNDRDGLVIQTILKNHHLVRCLFPMSPHLQVRLMSACWSSYVYDNNSVS
jgi:hypothetical protein